MTINFRKIETGTYRVLVDGRVVGTVVRREDSSRTGALWVAKRAGFVQGVHTSRAEAAEALAAKG